MKKQVLIIIGVIAVVIISTFAIIYNDTLEDLTGKVLHISDTVKKICYDSDNTSAVDRIVTDESYKTKGYIRYSRKWGFANRTVHDYCNIGKTRVREYYCTEIGEAKYALMTTCENGCEDGACK